MIPGMTHIHELRIGRVDPNADGLLSLDAKLIGGPIGGISVASDWLDLLGAVMDKCDEFRITLTTDDMTMLSSNIAKAHVRRNELPLIVRRDYGTPH